MPFIISMHFVMFCLLCLNRFVYTEEKSVIMYMKREYEFDDRVVDGNYISKEKGVKFMDCSMLCSSQENCLSFYYGASDFTCITYPIVFYDPALATPEKQYVYYRIVKGNSEIEPKKDCGDPSSLLPATFRLLPGLSHATAVRWFLCPDPYVQKRPITCLTNGTWNASFTCPALKTCKDIQECSSENMDGEYNLFPLVFGGQPVKVFCSGLTDRITAAAFITLYEMNESHLNFSKRVSVNPCQYSLDPVTGGVATYYKIGVNENDFSVRTDDIKYCNHDYHGTQDRIIKYGMAWDCSHQYYECLRTAWFVVNTNGTGLKINPLTKWILNGFRTKMEDFKWSDDGYMASARCGGECGKCEPKDMKLDYVKGAEIRGETPRIPTCA